MGSDAADVWDGHCPECGERIDYEAGHESFEPEICLGCDYNRCMHEIVAKDAEIARLRVALESIADSPHCQYENSKDGTSYGVGVADGHRCAATTARAALTPRKEV